jgi:Fur family peroxide stress response transcriptional regulator
MLTVETGVKYLQDSGAKITAPRIAILKLLENRKDHPSAEQIFLELKPAYPTLSIATVYSTAQLLAKGSMLRILSIDEKKVYYDPDMDSHAHFLCRGCKRLFDVSVGCDVMRAFMPTDGISSVEMAEIYYYGLCRQCSRAA